MLQIKYKNIVEIIGFIQGNFPVISLKSLSNAATSVSIFHSMFPPIFAKAFCWASIAILSEKL
jgi:hypothetical protein